MGSLCSVDRGEGATISVQKLVTSAAIGDLVVLTNEEETHYGILLKDKDASPRSPPLLAMASLPDEDGTCGVRLTSAIATIVYDKYRKVTLKRLSRSADVSYQEAKSLASQTARQSTPDGVLIKVFSSLGVVMTKPRPFPSGYSFLPVEQVVVRPMKPGPLAEKEDSAPFYHQWITTITKDRPHQLLDDMLPTMNTGDIVLMCCVSVMRGSVRVGEGGNFNHVAIVIKDPLVGAPCLWETFDNREVTCLDAASPTGGVTYVPFAARVRWGWDSPIAVRHLDISDERRKEMERVLVNLRCKYAGATYNKVEHLEPVSSHFLSMSSHTNNDASTESITCSELVAFSYHECGLLERDKPPNEYSPDDFTSGCKHPLRLIEGTLQEEIYINLDAVHTKTDCMC